MMGKLGGLMGKADLAYILLPRNDTAAAAPAVHQPATTTEMTGANSREEKSLELSVGSGLDHVMPVTEEPYITDLDLDSYLSDVTDNVLDLVTTTELTQPPGWLANETAAEVTGLFELGSNGTVIGNLTDVLLDQPTLVSVDFTYAVTELSAEEGSGVLSNHFNNPDTDFTSPGMDFTNPGMDFTSPGTDFASHGMDFTSPGTGLASPGMDFTNPGMDFTSPSTDFASHGMDFTSPGTGFASPDMVFTSPGTGFASPGTDFTSPGTDFTSNIYDIITGQPTSDLLANGLELISDPIDLIDNVNNIFEDKAVTSLEDITEDLTQNALHSLFVTVPQNSDDHDESRDYTDNVFRMLFHSDQLDGLLELGGGGGAADPTTNCSVWNVTETVGAANSSGRYTLDHDIYLGELVLAASLCIPASLAVIFYILRLGLDYIISRHLVRRREEQFHSLI